MATRTLYVDDGYTVGDIYTQTGVTVDWKNKIVFVPKIAMILIQTAPTVIYQLDLNVFRLALKELEAGEGMPYVDIHSHNPTVSVGGVELARVVQIINGYTITFEDEQYAVNLLGANSNVGDVINVNQVSVRSANSAGLVSSQAIEFGEYEGTVQLNSSSGESGALYPIGTLRRPVNNGVDAQLIADVRGFKTITINQSETITTPHNLMKFFGRSPRNSTLTIDSSASLFGCEFEDMLLTGDLTGNGTAYFTSVAVKDCLGIAGHFEICIIREGTNTIAPNGIMMANKCASVGAFSPGVQIPIIDCNGTGRIAFREWSGEVIITNKTGGTQGMSLALAGGKVTLDSTVTSGEWRFSGVGTLVDNSTGNATVDSGDLLVPTRLTNLQYLVEESRESHIGTGSIWYWDPYNGSDANDGESPTFAVRTFATAHALAKDWGHDIIVAVPGNPNAVTISTDPIIISKNWVFLRGPGADFIIQPTTTNGDGSLISTTGNTGTEIAGITLDGINAGSCTGIIQETDDSLISSVKILNITGNAIETNDCANPKMKQLTLNNISGTGLRQHNCIGVSIDIIDIYTADIGFYSTADTLGLGGNTNIDNLLVMDANVGVQFGTNITKSRLRSNSRFVNVNSHVVNNGVNTHIEKILTHLYGGKTQSSTINTVTLDVNASSLSGKYDPSFIQITGGTGQGQLRLILEYDGATKIATVDRDWKILPDSTSSFVISPTGGRMHVNEGLLQGAGTSNCILNASASSTNDVYNGQLVFIRSGLGEDQVGHVVAYDGTTKVATVDTPWSIIPDSTSGYEMLPAHAVSAAEIWEYDISNVNITGSAANVLISEFSSISTSLGNIEATGGSLTTEQATQLGEMYALYGLDPTKPLVVSNTSIVAGATITQTVDCNVTSETTTITRT